MKERILIFDILRCIAIIGVIAIHSTGVGYTFDDTSISFIVTVIWRLLVNFSVPLFLALSGFFIYDSNVSNKGCYFKFLRKKIPRVYIPYFLWSLVYLILPIKSGISYSQIIYELLTFQTASPFYFILLIIQYYLLLPFLKKITSKEGLVLSGAISLISCIIINMLIFNYRMDLPLYTYAGAFPTWLFFFVLGLYIRKYGISLEIKNIVFLCLLSYIFSLFETYVLYEKTKDIANNVSAIKISSFAFSAFIILLLFKLSITLNKKLRGTNIFVYIGEISFGIYLSHILVKGFISSFLHTVSPQIASSPLLYQILIIPSTLIGCLIINILIRGINKKIAIKYLGQ